MNQRSAAYFLAAVVLSFVVGLPCAHTHALFVYHHFTLAQPGLQPALVDGYIKTALELWLILSFALTALVWGQLWALSPHGHAAIRTVTIGAVLGIVAGQVLYSNLNPSFQRIAATNLDEVAFVYGGVWAGILTGELCRRSMLSSSEPHRRLELDFILAAITTWAVLLKLGACAYESTLQPGQPTLLFHLLPFLSILLWTPRVCAYLWRHRPRHLVHSIVRSCAMGILLPPFVSLILFPLVGLLLMVKVNLYPILWGDMVFFAFLRMPQAKYYLLTLLPGFTWGVVVGILRWRYLSKEQAIGSRKAVPG
jgi:hypothetical protein